MAIRKIDGAWCVDFRFNRERIRRKSPEDSRRGAEAFELLLKRKLLKGESIEATEEPKELTFKEFAWEWYKTFVITNSKASGSRTRESALRLHLVPWFGKKLLSEITPEDIERYKRQKQSDGFANKSLNDHLSTLRTCLSHAVKWKKIDRIPDVKRLKTHLKKVEHLSHDELEKLLSVETDSIWHLMALVASNTGLRLGEMFGLDWKDVDFKRQQIVVQRAMVRGVISSPKGNRTRLVPMNRRVLCALLPVRKAEGLVFQTEGVEHLDYSAANNAIKRLCRQAGIRSIWWHLLRHTFASHLIERQVSIVAVQQLLGHSSIITTQRYAHLTPSTLDDAVAALDGNRAHEFTSFGQQVGINLETVFTPKTGENQSRL
ncbi:site-specific integrase [Candidatus Uhrbacteria bacterium]|nr:site-specific integrase [Candidatus Uhrbacteria bacterium]